MEVSAREGGGRTEGARGNSHGECEDGWGVGQGLGREVGETGVDQARVEVEILEEM